VSFASNEILQSEILIVDDNPINVTLLEQMLEDENYEHITSTTDPREVVPLCQNNSFDLILLDIRMPQMTGIEVLQALAEPLKDDFLPVLVLTAQTDDETRSQALSAGASDFLTKPFKQWEVLLRIHNMLATRLYYKCQRIRADTLESEVQERTREIKQAQLDLMQCLGRAGEYRDNEMGAHVLRMSKSCALLAQAAGFNDGQVIEILYASAMHDVGKIGISDGILLKPGRLELNELKMMQCHAAIGAEIIGSHSSKLLVLARQIALYHHEKWDGSGYPKGLRGEAIPVESRIAAICDVFDALTSERPYKKAWPYEEALAWVEGEAGKHFDPGLVKLFMKIAPEVYALKDEFPDSA